MHDRDECPPYDEKLYKVPRQYDEKGRPRKHSRWRASSNVLRYSKPQENWFAKNIREADGWRNGARVYA